MGAPSQKPMSTNVSEIPTSMHGNPALDVSSHPAPLLGSDRLQSRSTFCKMELTEGRALMLFALHTCTAKVLTLGFNKRQVDGRLAKISGNVLKLDIAGRKIWGSCLLATRTLPYAVSLRNSSTFNVQHPKSLSTYIIPSNYFKLATAAATASSLFCLPQLR